MHVCKRWRTALFASPSRLDLYFVVTAHKGGSMTTLLSCHFPPLPIVIIYKCSGEVMKAKEMGRMLAALKHPDRIREITLVTGSTADLGKFFEATRGPFPILESLELCDCNGLKIPATFLKGLDLPLQTLKLYRISLPESLPSISRLLLSAPGLTTLFLLIDTNVDLLPGMMLLLPYLQGMPCLSRLDLRIIDKIDIADSLAQPAKPEEKFQLSRLTSFHYHGHSAYFDTFVAGFASPSLQEVNIWLDDKTLPPIPHLPRFIDEIGKHYHAVKVVLARDDFKFSLLGRSEYAGGYYPDHFSAFSPSFRLRTTSFRQAIKQLNSAFSTRLATIQELFVVTDGYWGEAVPWRRLLRRFPSVKALRLEGGHNVYIARDLYHNIGGLNHSFLPLLEEIELCTESFFDPNFPSVFDDELEAFDGFVSARQQAGLPVKVFWGPPLCLRKLP